MVENERDALQAMSDWLEQREPFGQRPVESGVLAHYFVEWPWFEDPQDVFLVEYRLADGRQGVGVTGPVTWSFANVSFDDFDSDDLLALYAGWYLVSSLTAADGYAPDFDAADDQEILELLREEGFGPSEIIERYRLGDRTFYEIETVKDGQAFKAAGCLDDFEVYEPDCAYMRLPAIFTYLGFHFFGSLDEP